MPQVRKMDTRFKKGEHPNPKTEFKKGLIPWNKDKKMSGEYKQQCIKNTLGKKRKPFTDEHRRNIGKTKSGLSNWNWKGGITVVYKKIRQSIDYRLWREAVFARDNYTCQKCFALGGKLRPHHIKNFSQFPELRFAIDNGITLCEDCHKKFHHIFGLQSNTKEQVGLYVYSY